MIYDKQNALELVLDWYRLEFWTSLFAVCCCSDQLAHLTSPVAESISLFNLCNDIISLGRVEMSGLKIYLNNLLMNNQFLDQLFKV